MRAMQSPLQTGVADALDLTKSAYTGFKLYEVVPCVSQTAHIWADGVVTSPHHLASAAGRPWPHQPQERDTIWMGVADAQGRSVSYIQTLCYEFSSGLVSLGRRSFTTLNPAMAFFFDDGRQLTIAP